MAYKGIYLPDAERQLAKLEIGIAKRILRKIDWFISQRDPLRFGVSLQAKIGDVRFRIGDYRVIVLVDKKKKVIYIASVGHRREIYKW